MIPSSCRRLAEVDFPIAVVSKHAAREKSIRHGHPSTLHLWWARRPLAACRAVLMALLLPDPDDAHCPADFLAEARRILLAMHGRPARWDKQVATGEGLRRTLLEFIAAFADWDHSAEPAYLETARSLVRAAYPDEPPLVVDPFAGGGSIPLEALRIGCEAFASDLNPVACLIEKVMLEDIPRHGPALAEELRRVGAEIKAAAEKELAEFYPPDPDGARPIAYLWSRTVRCETPGCGAEIPLVRSFWLSKKANRRRALRHWVVRQAGQPPRVEFEIFEPSADADRNVPAGTVSRARATCPACSIVLTPERVRAQLSVQRGGADVIFDDQGHRIGGARLLAVVTLRDGEDGRGYRLPQRKDYESVWLASAQLAEIADGMLPNELISLPHEPLPTAREKGNSGFRVLLYGMKTFGDLFTNRQKLVMLTIARTIHNLTQDRGQGKALAGLALSRYSDIFNALCRWENTKTQVRNLFGRQAIPMLWDFAEPDPFGGQAGDYLVTVETMARVLEAFPQMSSTGQVQQADATMSPLPDDSAALWFTDPPYYDSIAYADLSDFFYVWLKRAMDPRGLPGDPFDSENPLTPKIPELIVSAETGPRVPPKTRDFFLEGMTKAFEEGRRISQDDGVACVVFAHKSTEGWEALLSGMLEAGWTITASWPVTTEMSTRMVARDTAALAASVHLICRPRPDDAPIGDWALVLRELPRKVAAWMDRLQREGVRGADLVFACIGPALEIYSRYSKVVDAEEREIPLGGDPEAREPHQRGYLAYVWETVARMALEQVLGTTEAQTRDGAAGALEEDARLTALFLWTMQSTTNDEGPTTKDDTEEEAEEVEDEEDEPTRGKKPKGFSLVYDVARRFSQPLGIHLDDWKGRIIDIDKGVVRLLPVGERARQLFGEDGAEAVAAELESTPAGVPGAVQLRLFGDEEKSAPRVRSRGRAGRSVTGVADAALRTRLEATTLDRVHAAMLLQKAGRTNALRALLAAEIERGPDFLRLANALSALYPRESEEKRLLDAMVLAVPR